MTDTTGFFCTPSGKSRQVFFRFTDNMIHVSYCQGREKETERNVTLLSTDIYGNNIGEVALHYNRMKVAEHPGDQMTRQHTCI